MKIAVFHELNQGGARRTVNEFTKRLREKHIVDLYIVDSEKNLEELPFFTNIFFYKFVPKKWHGGDWKIRLYKDTVEVLKLYILHRKIARIINNNKYEVAFIHPSKYTQSPFVLQFLKPFSIYYCQEPLRIAYEDIFKQKKTDIFRYWYEKANRSLRMKIDAFNIRGVDKILVNSEFSKRNIANAYEKESEVCYLGVDTGFFKPCMGKKDTDILFVGSDDDIDGYPLLEKVVKHMNLKPKIKVINSKAWASEAALLDAYQRARIVVCFAHNEPFGLIPLEAASCGSVAVVVDEGGYKESIIDGKTGFLVSRNPIEIAKKLDWLLSNLDKVSTISKIARENVVKNWTWDKSVQTLWDILSKQ
ncbi:MAG: glycosyltransferase family 4 protein [Patescibacteria group bacterium]